MNQPNDKHSTPRVDSAFLVHRGSALEANHAWGFARQLERENRELAIVNGEAFDRIKALEARPSATLANDFERECQDGDKLAEALGIPRTEGGSLYVQKMLVRIAGLKQQASRYAARRMKIYETRMRLQVGGERIRWEDFVKEYDAACDKEAVEQAAESGEYVGGKS